VERDINYGARDIANIVTYLLNIVSESITIFALYCMLLVTQWQMTLALTLILGTSAFLYVAIIANRSKIQGTKRVEANKVLFSLITDVSRNYKFIRLKNNQETILHEAVDSTNKIAHAYVLNGIFNAIPHGFFECLGFSLLIGAMLFLTVAMDNTQHIVSIIAMYAISLYRIMPGLTRIMQAVNSLALSLPSLKEVYTSLHIPVVTEYEEPIAFIQSISLKHCSFSYATGGTVLREISLKINKGEKVAITGESGCGKTTLLDLIIGVNPPSEGQILIDNQPITDQNRTSWRSKIGYIPQDIYLFDGTVGENVAFGSNYEEDRIINALKRANIWNFLQEKHGLQTRVGEGGVQLSGGQKQRIGIARALYDDPEVLVLDEATSSLDIETESKIMDEIYNVSRDKTLVVVAHRLSTVERCERKIRLEHGEIAV
jgi:ATP-binding cassette subfamily B protein/ATP-binding cassette subfamily C protein